jgi:hypothetical protein
MTQWFLLTHTNRHTYTQIGNLPVFHVHGKLSAIAEVPVLPYCGETFNA